MEHQSKRTRKIIQQMSLLDDDFMSIVFDRNIEATELLLNIILGREDLKVLEVVGQREYKAPSVEKRSICIDIYARDAKGKIYDIEVQRSNSGASFQRARYHSSIIDTRMLDAGQDFKEIHELYVIFITEKDILGAGLPIYHVDRYVEETREKFTDGSHIIYVNGSYRNTEDPIGRLMHDFGCLNSKDMLNPVLAKQVKYYKETEGGLRKMCKLMEDYGREIAEETARETAIRMLKNGKLSIGEIAECANLPLEIIENIQQELLVKK